MVFSGKRYRSLHHAFKRLSVQANSSFCLFNNSNVLKVHKFHRSLFLLVQDLHNSYLLTRCYTIFADISPEGNLEKSILEEQNVRMITTDTFASGRSSTALELVPQFNVVV